MKETIWTKFEAVASQTPRAVAISYPGRPDLSYAELQSRAVRLAIGPQLEGFQPGDRIALVAENGPWFAEWLLACACAGLVLIPVNIRLSAVELEFIVRDASPRLILCDETRLEVFERIEHGSSELAGVEPEPWMTSKEMEGCVTEFADAGQKLPILQIYTSGTTGRPKGAVITHDNLTASMLSCIPALGAMGPTDVVLVCLPLFHIAGICFVAFGLVTGAKLLILPRIVPEEVVEAIDEHRVSTSLLVPAVVRMLVEVLERRGHALATLRTLVFGSSPMPVELIARAARVMKNARLHHVYGLTETTGIVTCLPPAEVEAGRRLLSCGRALPGGEIGIFGADGGGLPPGEIGEVAYRGAQALLEYWNLPEATRAAVKEGWFFTGDAGYLDDEGYLFLQDRFKDMIKSGGENVYPAEVENILLQHPVVADCAVFGVADEKWGELVAAAIVARDGKMLDLEELREFSRTYLAGYKLPKRIFHMPQLPRSSTGKVQKNLLREQFR